MTDQELLEAQLTELIEAGRKLLRLRAQKHRTGMIEAIRREETIFMNVMRRCTLVELQHIWRAPTLRKVFYIDEGQDHD